MMTSFGDANIKATHETLNWKTSKPSTYITAHKGLKIQEDNRSYRPSHTAAAAAYCLRLLHRSSEQINEPSELNDIISPSRHAPRVNKATQSSCGLRKGNSFGGQSQMVRYQSAVTSVCVYMGAYYIVPSGGTPIENNKTQKSWLIAYSNTIIVSSAHTRIAFNLYVWNCECCYCLLSISHQNAQVVHP